jgi:UDP:flavonoid glycosyltransferase YjiC (YdhE family)
MRALVTCWPFTGHVHGQLAVAAALRARGHEVAFYTGAAAQPIVKSAGFPVYGMTAVDEAAVGACVDALEQPRQSGRNNLRALREAFRIWLVESIPGQMNDLQPVLSDWLPDVIVCDMSMWGPQLILHDLTGTPVVLSSTFLGPLIPGPDAPPSGLGFPPPRTLAQRLFATGVQTVTDLAATGLRRRVDELRAGYGLPPLGRPVNEFTGTLPLYLVPSISELDYGRRDLPDTVHYVGPCNWQPERDEHTTDWLAGIPSDAPWVHVTESTLRTGDPFLLRAAAAGLANLPLQVVATSGRHRDPEALGLGGTADNFHLTSWVNHEQLLPRCSAVVTTGGAATVTAALSAGVPLVVVPTTWDKPDNARRVTEAGAGIRLSPKKCTGDALRDAVQTVLTDPSYARNARRIGGLLRAAPGAGGAARLIESLVAPGQLARAKTPAKATLT